MGENNIKNLETSIFLLSLTELGKSSNYANIEGTALPIANTLLIALYEYNKTIQWTRTPAVGTTNNVCCLGIDGNVATGYCNSSYGIRPCFTLPSTITVGENNLIS